MMKTMIEPSNSECLACVPILSVYLNHLILISTSDNYPLFILQPFPMHEGKRLTDTGGWQ